MGRAVRSWPITSAAGTFAVDDLAPGVYTLHGVGAPVPLARTIGIAR